MVARRAPRFHTLVHLTIILASIAAAVAAITAWSQHVETAADEAAKAAHAVLYDSDIGAESLGLILTVLFAAGWLCGSITWRRGSENARSGWAADLVHEPAKNKAITDWLWRQMIRRHTDGAVNADDFLDRVSGGVVSDLPRRYPSDAWLDCCARRVTAGARLLCDRYDHNGSSCAALGGETLCGRSELQRPSSPAVRTCRRTAISSFTDWALRTDQRQFRRLATAGGKPSRGSRSHRGPIAGGDRP